MEKLFRMGRLFLAGALAAVVAAPPALAQVTGDALLRPLTLADVFRQVEGANLRIRAGAAGVEASRQEARQALAQLLPAIRAEASQTRQRQPLIGGFYDELEGVPSAIHSNNFEAGLSVTVPLVEPYNIANWRAMKLQQRAAELDQVTNVQDAYALAAELYFTHLRNLSRLEVIRSNIERDELLLDVARQRREAGVATELDVTRSLAALARDRQDMLAQQTLVSQTRLAILRVMNLPPSTRLHLADQPPRPPQTASLPAVDSVVESRPEHEAAKAILRRNRVAERAADWQRFPDIALIGRWGVIGEEAFDGEREEAWLVGITLSMPIWEGGRIRAEKLQARALVRQQEYVLQDIEGGISADYQLALEALQQRWDELPFAREAVALSQQELHYARERFEAGVADNADVVSAQATLAAANDAEVEAAFRYHLARITLARVLGRVAEELTH